MTRSGPAVFANSGLTMSGFMGLVEILKGGPQAVAYRL